MAVENHKDSIVGNNRKSKVRAGNSTTKSECVSRCQLVQAVESAVGLALRDCRFDQRLTVSLCLYRPTRSRGLPFWGRWQRRLRAQPSDLAYRFLVVTRTQYIEPGSEGETATV